MYNAALRKLVVLSVCDTAPGKRSKAKGLMSVRGFMYSGAPRVLASLWKIDDEATAELMREFYIESSSIRSDARSGASTSSDTQMH